MQTKRAFYSHSNDKAVKLYAISHKINYREKRSSPWPLVHILKIWLFELYYLVLVSCQHHHLSSNGSFSKKKIQYGRYLENWYLEAGRDLEASDF